MAPTRKSRSVNKRFSYPNEISPIKDGDSSTKSNKRVSNFCDNASTWCSNWYTVVNLCTTCVAFAFLGGILPLGPPYPIQKRKVSDMLGPQWSKEELQRFYEAYRKYGKDWKKVSA